MDRKTFGAVLTALVVGYAGSSSGYSTLVSLGNPFTVARLYSDASGDAQFVELDPVPGTHGPDEQTMPSLMVTNRYGVTKLFTLTNPGMRTTTSRVIVASQSLAARLPPGYADAVMPDRFLPTDGGTVSFGASDRWSYEALPVDGTSLYRDGSLGDATVLNARGQSAYAASGTRVIYEFYHAGLDRYFMSGSQPDIDALDSGRIGGWSRTGQVLLAPTEWVLSVRDVQLDPIEQGVPPGSAVGGPDVHLDPIERGGPQSRVRVVAVPSTPIRPGAPPWMRGTVVPVCRYLLPSGSHFFSASAAECDAVGTVGGVALEASNAFLAWLPYAASGACPTLPEGAVDVHLIPVYRLWNGRADSNHRYTTDPATRDRMLRAGWIAEGYGGDGVAMCVPSAPSL